MTRSCGEAWKSRFHLPALWTMAATAWLRGEGVRVVVSCKLMIGKKRVAAAVSIGTCRPRTS